MNTPAVSIILPTYNRAKFLPEAIGAIRGQLFTDWELIVVDDGSTDETAELLPKLIERMPQQYRYIRQENQGAYAARNTGLDHVSGRYVAFYDSDDLWLPHHLQKCVTALEQSPDIGWVYSASRIVDHASGRVLNENCFQEQGQLHRFRTLPCDLRDDLHVLKHEGLFDAVLGGAGLYSGLQNSVIRSRFFDGRRFVTEFYNEAEDQVVVLRAIAAGVGFAYFDEVHVEYRVHESNSSGAALGMPREKRLRLAQGLIRGFEELPQQVSMTLTSKSLLRKKLAELYMWQLGYHANWIHGYKREALAAYRRGIQLDSWNPSYWKTYVLSVARTLPDVGPKS
ncbi:glycosyltransferase [Planctellipticum variicoloris]|uniref:glycosyltransferase n=1 Tax=Planctellipticum variicoloris TaxID=3064265 RepID=UPI003013BFC0|nr:glycosyltransferase family 2 protein [Planctomycetaceae bacterium SH412]